MEKEREIHLIHYLGKRRALMNHYIKLFLFGLLTIGFYGCWGLTDIRKYMIRNIQIGKDRLAYSGQGLHLFLGIILLFLYHILSDFWEKFTTYVVGGYVTNPMLALFCIYFSLFISLVCAIILYEMCGYCSWRYVLAHLSWRGIRGCFQGTLWRYGFLCVYRTGLNILSLTFLTPWSDMVKYKYRTERSRVGSTPFSFQYGSFKKLFRTHVITLLYFPFTLGISRLWYQAALRNHQWNHTVVGNLRLRSTYTGWGLCKLYVGNFFLIAPPFLLFILILIYIFIFNQMYILKFLQLSMGIRVIGCVVCGLLFFAYLAVFLSVVAHRNARYVTQHTAVLGDLELFFETQKETLSVEPVGLPSIDFGSVFPI
jgi:uncharacterized membrane protein YjgN (DUF898 family)